MVCLLLWPIVNVTLNPYLYATLVTLLEHLYVYLWSCLLQLFLKNFSLSFLRGMLNKFLKSSVRVMAALVWGKNKSESIKFLVYVVSTLHGDGLEVHCGSRMYRLRHAAGGQPSKGGVRPNWDSWPSGPCHSSSFLLRSPLKRVSVIFQKPNAQLCSTMEILQSWESLPVSTITCFLKPQKWSGDGGRWKPGSYFTQTVCIKNKVSRTTPQSLCFVLFY